MGRGGGLVRLTAHSTQATNITPLGGNSKDPRMTGHINNITTDLVDSISDLSRTGKTQDNIMNLGRNTSTIPTTSDGEDSDPCRTSMGSILDLCRTVKNQVNIINQRRTTNNITTTSDGENSDLRRTDKNNITTSDSGKTPDQDTGNNLAQRMDPDPPDPNRSGMKRRSNRKKPSQIMKK